MKRDPFHLMANALLAITLAWGCGASEGSAGNSTAGASGAAAAAGQLVAIVHRDPNCGCCAEWIVHMRENGFTVQDDTTSSLSAVKERLGVPARLQTCHTAEIDGYVIEGHVPVDVVKRLLAEKPADVVGIAVPGMPVGSPGMEMPGRAAAAYEILAWDRTGKTWVYDRR